MGKLREEMLMEMHLTGYSEKTIESYIGHMKAYTKLHGKSPAVMGEDEIRKYLYHLKVQRQVSPSNISQAYSALKLFYTKVLNRSWNFDRIPRIKREKKLPVVLSLGEIQRLFEVITNLKHRAMLMTAYSGGLRVKETAHLKVSDIDSNRMTIRVQQSKGRRDRYTLLSARLLVELRAYYKQYRPQSWLFAGKDQDKPITIATLQRIFKQAKKKPESASLQHFIPCVIALLPTF